MSINWHDPGKKQNFIIKIDVHGASNLFRIWKDNYKNKNRDKM
jgi:hypothetical protein